MDIEPLMIAVAATSTAGDDAWVADLLKGVLPVVTLVVGWGLKWLQDNYTESKRRAAEAALRREQRQELLRARRLDTERENLNKAQDLLGRIGRLHAQVYFEDERAHRETGKWGSSPLPPELDEQYRAAMQELMPVRARLHSRDIAKAIDSTTATMARGAPVKDPVEAKKIWLSASHQCMDVQERVGDRIREIESDGLEAFFGNTQLPTKGE
ncbi:hypothetical protein ABIA68_001298 [Stenotrophomonas rhizophila]|uniref:hypothetical protein n=1 Tax=Stenotrophomonas rhizophila TaxID=216778 RepID=UPI0033938559